MLWISFKTGIGIVEIVRGLIGLLGFILIAVLLSENRRAIKVKPIITGVVLQIVTAVILSKVTWVIDFFQWINNAVLALTHATEKGTAFVFGYAGGGPAPFELAKGGAAHLFVFAFQALPLILVIAALCSIFFYLGVLPRLIILVSWFFKRLLGVGGPLATGMASNLFVGMVESPFVIQPYLKVMTRNEIFTMMTCGMAGVAGTVMALYVVILNPVIPDVMVHIISAVVISVPAVVVISRIMLPETEEVTVGSIIHQHESLNVIDALISGIKQGLEVFAYVIGTLIVLIALVSFIDIGLGHLPKVAGHTLSLTYLLGFVFQPFMWLMGIPWHETHIAGELMAQRMVLNEVVSFQSLANLPKGTFDPRVNLMMMYAMCGFANFSGLGIMMASYNALVPSRKRDVVNVGLRTMIAGTLCTCMTATIMGMIY